MASGIYGQVALTASINNTVFGQTVATVGTYNIRLVNTTSTALSCGLAISATATPAANEWIESSSNVIPAYGILEEQGIPIQAGKYIVALPSATGVNAIVWGIE